MAIITPTITTDDVHEFREQLEQIALFSEGVHFDFSDGIFTPSALVPIESVWRNDSLIIHAHIMYQNPLLVIEDIMHLEADLVILHAESDNLKEALIALNEYGTRTGVALLPETSHNDLIELDIDRLFDHVLVFGGHLGYQGGDADLTQLHKVKELKKHYPDVEIGWDGGVTEENARIISGAGVDVLNVGSGISRAQNPKKAYTSLSTLVS